MPIRRIAALCAALILSLSACGGGSSPDVTGRTPSTIPVTPTSTGDSTGGSSAGLPDGFGPGPSGSGLQRFYDQKLEWKPCDQGECASVWVPLDYADPDGQAITVNMAKHEATDPSARLGSLFINPGGPGASGVDFVTGNPLDDKLTSHYDVIGFDPRGVASSTPVDCLSDSALDEFVAFDPDPQGQAEIHAFEAEWSRYVNGCKDRSGPLLAHVSTVDVARDLDVMRALVGDPTLNYFGFSYGTYIGATYAGLFPQKVGRMVLDGAIDPEASPLRSEILQTRGFETALTAYLQDCISQGCPFGDTVAEGKQKISDLLDSIATAPLPTQSGRDLTEGLALYGVFLPLYDRQSWPYETQALTTALQGQGDILLAFADIYADRNSDGSYASNRIEVNAAVNCLDNPQHESVADVLAGANEFERGAPVFGRIGAWFPYACSNWPVTADEPKPDFSAPGAPPIVVIGTTRDPATPYSQAVALSNELQSGVLISRNGDGHTGYGKGNGCVDGAVDTYLVEGKPPRDGLSC